MTLGEFAQQLKHILLPDYVPEEAKAITRLVLENLTGIPPGRQAAMLADELLPAQEATAAQWVQKLARGIPVQYVLGEAWFMNRIFNVNPSVLIPRPETEELVLWALEAAQAIGKPGLKILDVGTGSGCIAVSVALALPHARITAIDIAPQAIDTAKANAQKHGAHIDWYSLDFLNPAEWAPLGSFDLVVSNPPYIPLAEKNMLERQVVAFEPHEALFTPTEDPLIFYKALAAFAASQLLPGGWLLAEGHQLLMANVKDTFSKVLQDVTIRRDVHNNERMAGGKK